ncbi:helix-turn-helix transcriptional regulator [Roseibium salinum]|uniref:YafY family protein n=1 Tax=Roseibium salinum TaxID=1604349 RepID=A0ABT3R3C9_9HYPH|nr:YafY family protein [Roseibium sp. DSM 29163]MCX2723487.1 YafY family protein [Roseibium sp. DSM 29163]MDN3718637.1 YafY family protein [Roseibium salinum]
MARTDRLMRLMDTLRRLPQPVTASRLSEETGVSLRQLYRDIATLRAGGALIDGAAGIGYTLVEDPALPPQSFSRIEIEALMLALSGLEQIGDDGLTQAGRNAMARIIATLPDAQARQAMHTVLRSWRRPDARPAVTIDMDLLREACWEEFSLQITYRDLREQVTERKIWPLGLSYGADKMMLLAHCRLRQDFRIFHVNRIEQLSRGEESFRPRRVGLLRDYVAQRRKEYAQAQR